MPDKYEMFLREEIGHAEHEKERETEQLMRMAFVGKIAAFKAALHVYIQLKKESTL